MVALAAIVLQVVLTSLVPLADAVVTARATSVATSPATHAHGTQDATESSAPSTHCVVHCAFCQLIATRAELPGVPARAALAESVAKFNDDVQQAKETFLALLGHDLRLPLGAILTSATYLF